MPPFCRWLNRQLVKAVTPRKATGPAVLGPHNLAAVFTAHLLLLILKSAMPIPVSKQPAATQTIPDVIKCFEKPLTTVHGGRHHLVTIIPDILICSSLACSHLSTWIFLTNRPESVRLGPFPFLQGLTPLSTNMTVPHSIPPLQICRRNAAIGLTSKRDESAYRDEIRKPSTNNLT